MGFFVIFDEFYFLFQFCNNGKWQINLSLVSNFSANPHIKIKFKFLYYNLLFFSRLLIYFFWLKLIYYLCFKFFGYIIDGFSYRLKNINKMFLIPHAHIIVQEKTLFFTKFNFKKFWKSKVNFSKNSRIKFYYNR